MDITGLSVDSVMTMAMGMKQMSTLSAVNTGLLSMSLDNLGAQAISSFGDAKTNNAAVAQICAGNYSAAKSVLNAVANKDAMTYYLCAIVGARTNNSSDVQSNLAKAISMDSSLKNKAANDLEFAKFASVISAL